VSAPVHPTSRHYAFERLEDGVYFGRARREGTGLCNTGLVDLGDSLLIFDTSLTLDSAREIRASAEGRSRGRPIVGVNSHWHLDHVFGNQVFDGGPIYATNRTIELLLEQRGEFEKELSPEKLRAEIQEYEGKQRAEPSSAGRERCAFVLRLNRALLGEVAEWRFTPATAGFDQELTFPGERGARLFSFGAGHTESDALLFLPKSRILFAGDLLVAETHPNLGSGDPVHWLEVLREIEALRPERIVTGHGPLGSIETIRTMRDYLNAVLQAARVRGPPEVPSQFASWEDPETFASNVEYTRTRLAGDSR
jgi:cyclase